MEKCPNPGTSRDLMKALRGAVFSLGTVSAGSVSVGTWAAAWPGRSRVRAKPSVSLCRTRRLSGLETRGRTNRHARSDHLQPARLHGDLQFLYASRFPQLAVQL